MFIVYVIIPLGDLLFGLYQLHRSMNSMKTKKNTLHKKIMDLSLLFSSLLFDELEFYELH